MKTALAEILSKKISEEGPMTFARFMEECLYHPEHGYYTHKTDQTLDYLTAPDRGPWLGEIIACQLTQMWNQMDRGPIMFVEMGAGTGALAEDVLEHLKAETPDLWPHFTYLLVERSHARQERSRERLKSFENKLAYSNSIPKGFVGCVISNELIDAFPVHRVRMHEGKLQEMRVIAESDYFAASWGDPSTPSLERYLKRLKLELPEGYETEINLAGLSWMRQVSSSLSRGFVVTIDYGYPADVYFDPARNKGTLRTFRRHRVGSLPLERVGEQDITSHVDFTSLALEGEKSGLTNLVYTDLSSFLAQGGTEWINKKLEDETLEPENHRKNVSALKELLHPEGMGNVFQVLIQSKNVTELPLRGGRINRLGWLKLDQYQPPVKPPEPVASH